MPPDSERFAVAFVLFCVIAEVVLVFLLCLTDLSNGTIALWSCLGWVLIPFTCALSCVACYDCVGEWTAPKKAPKRATTNKVDPRPVDYEDTKDTTTEIDEDDSDTEDSSADTSTITC